LIMSNGYHSIDHMSHTAIASTHSTRQHQAPSTKHSINHSIQLMRWMDECSHK
jgi:hypothetical protein